MSMPGQLRAVLGGWTRVKLRRQARAFLATTDDCRQTQTDVLRRLLSLNGDSQFATDYRFGEIQNVDDFRRRLPIADYDLFAPYIEKMKRGDHSALLGSQNKLLMFSLSSGTTSHSIYIPITQQFLHDYKRGWQVWGIHTFDEHACLRSRKVVQFSSRFDSSSTPGGTPCGNISGLVTAMQRWAVKTLYTVPGIVSHIESTDAKNYTAMRLALADREVGMVITANPSTLIQLAQLVDREKERLIRDIADGTLSPNERVDDEVRRALGRRISRPNRSRARELERVVESTGRLYPQDYWPMLRLVAVWTGGSAGAYLQSLRQYYGNVGIRDHGLSASEGRMTIPIADDRSDGILDVATHFFEFIPESDYESDQPTVLGAHELEEGRNYYILLTTSSGLCRYDICDVVRCVGFHGTTPMLEFLHKGAHISNITGEKISESQVVAAVRNSVERMQIDLSHFTISPVWGDPPAYQLLAEQSDVGSAETGQMLVASIDTQLQKLNREYRDKRNSGRLATMIWRPLPDGTWQRFARQRQRRLGGSLEQYKHPCLVPDVEFGSRLLDERVALAVEQPERHVTPRSGAAVQSRRSAQPSR